MLHSKRGYVLCVVRVNEYNVPKIGVVVKCKNNTCVKHPYAHAPIDGNVGDDMCEKCGYKMSNVKWFADGVIASIQELEELGGPDDLEQYILVLTSVKIEIEKRIQVAITNRRIYG